jgi:hypothetical protein
MMKVKQTEEAIVALEIVGKILAGAFKDGAQVSDVAVISAGIVANMEALKAGFTGLGDIDDEWKALGLRDGIDEGADMTKRLNKAFWAIVDASKG